MSDSIRVTTQEPSSSLLAGPPAVKIKSARTNHEVRISWFAKISKIYRRENYQVYGILHADLHGASEKFPATELHGIHKGILIVPANFIAEQFNAVIENCLY